ncbi:MAG: DUF3795 domain-containing protein [Candidatus Cloacimonadales bacterium]|nr:DUF3795 domain-containing protein [Candidatus Cloacimonadota bacterium]MCB5263693.1 DUF3795 domain-containing protein [Candidatus Cloacimonadota bacterium]MCK9434427.1 DUF3795 domain-containing protein [Candidatus Cloacimonadota bacterium]
MCERLMAPCGLNCARCDMYLATAANDDEARQNIADKWSQLFGYPFKKEDINCDGCLSGGRMSIYCRDLCEIKPCAQARGITDCAQCPDYICAKLQKNRDASAAYEH